MHLENIFTPHSIAIIGVSREESNVGHSILSNLKTGGFQGKLYAVNPKAEEILEIKSYKKVTDIPEDVDVAIIAVPVKAVEQVIQDCVQKDIHSLVIISAGFSETGDESQEEQLKTHAEKNGLTVIGPNCMGVINTGLRMNATFTNFSPKKGNISFLSQSGAMGTYGLQYARAHDLGFDRFISLGNKTVVTENELIDNFSTLDSTEVVLAYLEDFSDPIQLRKAAHHLVREQKKPFIVLKAGRSESGRKAASSHTGALSGKPEVIDDVLQQMGILKANDINDLFNLAQYFSLQKRFPGKRMVIISNAGGPSIVATDAAEKAGLDVVQLSEGLQEKISKDLPETVSVNNPIDLTGDATTERYEKALKQIIHSDEVDLILLINIPQDNTNLEELAQCVSTLWKEEDGTKTIVTNFTGFEGMDEVNDRLKAAGIPNYSFTTDAVKVLGTAHSFTNLSHEKTDTTTFNIDQEAANKALKSAQKSVDKHIPAPLSYPVFEAYDIKVADYRLADSQEEAAKLASEVGFPVAMSIVAQDIMHKTGTGGVELNIKSEEEAKTAYQKIITQVNQQDEQIEIIGVQVQQMLFDGPQMIMGVQKSDKYGHLLMFGLGGSFVEALKDVRFKIVPASREDVKEMISSIQSRELLEGKRGNKPSNIQSLEDGLLKLSQLVQDFPQIKEIDLNPVYALSDEATLADARIILE